ncbi:MAG TPA: sn-glycerol-1-phosphate dehydrogenase [Clostridiales bacterium]|nr:sn-glycerol-1-phosphate dehydrogenase [Clostridiales bacterium]
MKPFSQMNLAELIRPQGHECSCGRHHHAGARYIKIGSNALDALPGFMKELGVRRPFIIADQNTHKAAWHFLEPVLRDAGIAFTTYVFHKEHVEPDEAALGSLVMAFDPACDSVLALGSGVLNDLGKVFAHALRLPSMVVATAPSMDGYASDNASMIRDSVKVSLYNACPQVIIADTRILRDAPLRMLQAGLGDMLAKYVSICEWRVSHLVTGEYYCENIAGLVRASLKRIVDSVDGLKNRDNQAIENVTEGLILSGIAMAFAQISRPASGLEHYFSHLWEMMALQRSLPVELHGIQVGIGTLLTVAIWERIKHMTPSQKQAEHFIQSFDENTWTQMLDDIFGDTAKRIQQAAIKEGKNDPARHAQRLENTLKHWAEIIKIAQEELPSLTELENIMRVMDMPMSPQDIGFSTEDTQNALLGSREIRDKYLTSSLLRDLGVLYTQDWL